MRLFPALLVSFLVWLGCSKHPEQKVDSTSDIRAVPEAAMALRPAARNDTVSWADTTKRGDTTFFSRGRVITSTVVLTDSQWVSLSAPSGVPFGLFASWDGNALRPSLSSWTTLAYGYVPSDYLVARINYARTHRVRMVLALTGGARARYLTNGVFDMAKWKDSLRAFQRPDLKAALLIGVADGWIVGQSVMDEPFNIGGPGNEANGWGPEGTMSKARVDSMCAFAKQQIPGIPHGVLQDWSRAYRSSYKVCDFITSQYRYAKGSLLAYRDSGLALAKRDGHAIAWSINIDDGGFPAPVRRADGSKKTGYESGDCPRTTTGGKGSYFPNCRMTPAQVRESGFTLGSAGCFLTGFRAEDDLIGDPEFRKALQAVSDSLAKLPMRSCWRK